MNFDTFEHAEELLDLFIECLKVKCPSCNELFSTDKENYEYNNSLGFRVYNKRCLSRSSEYTDVWGDVTVKCKTCNTETMIYDS